MTPFYFQHHLDEPVVDGFLLYEARKGYDFRLRTWRWLLGRVGDVVQPTRSFCVLWVMARRDHEHLRGVSCLTALEVEVFSSIIMDERIHSSPLHNDCKPALSKVYGSISFLSSMSPHNCPHRTALLSSICGGRGQACRVSRWQVGHWRAGWWSSVALFRLESDPGCLVHIASQTRKPGKQ